MDRHRWTWTLGTLIACGAPAATPKVTLVEAPSPTANEPITVALGDSDFEVRITPMSTNPCGKSLVTEPVGHGVARVMFIHTEATPPLVDKFFVIGWDNVRIVRQKSTPGRVRIPGTAPQTEYEGCDADRVSRLGPLLRSEMVEGLQNWDGSEELKEDFAEGLKRSSHALEKEIRWALFQPSTLGELTQRLGHWFDEPGNVRRQESSQSSEGVQVDYRFGGDEFFDCTSKSQTRSVTFGRLDFGFASWYSTGGSKIGYVISGVKGKNNKTCKVSSLSKSRSKLTHTNLEEVSRTYLYDLSEHKWIDETTREELLRLYSKPHNHVFRFTHALAAALHGLDTGKPVDEHRYDFQWLLFGPSIGARLFVTKTYDMIILARPYVWDCPHSTNHNYTVSPVYKLFLSEPERNAKARAVVRDGDGVSDRLASAENVSLDLWSDRATFVGRPSLQWTAYSTRATENSPYTFMLDFSSREGMSVETGTAEKPAPCEWTRHKLRSDEKHGEFCRTQVGFDAYWAVHEFLRKRIPEDKPDDETDDLFHLTADAFREKFVVPNEHIFCPPTEY